MDQAKAEDLQQYIYDHIPIVEKNRFVIARDDRGLIVVTGSLRDHVNHRSSVFGGSLSTALILCAWANLRQLLLSQTIAGPVIVIQSQTVEFTHPVLSDFQAVLDPPSESEVSSFLAKLTRFGKSRIEVKAVITGVGLTAPLATFQGQFVVAK